jgi:haloacetate dehalogenase
MAEFFPGFEQRRIKTSGAEINLVTGGKGPPLLLLHGYPQTHLMWRKIAPRLAAEFTLVIPDLRGYGDSSKPPAGSDNENYSKRALALDQVEIMAALGHERFMVAGHDRGARVAHRLARDHAEQIERLALLDIVPTLYRFETIDQKAATSSWHWFFLIQPRGFPERLIGSEAEFFLRHQLSALLREPAKLEPEAFAEYLRCFKNPETIRATCDEYRAGASIRSRTRPRRSRPQADHALVDAVGKTKLTGQRLRCAWRLARPRRKRPRPRGRQRPLHPRRSSRGRLPLAARLFRRRQSLISSN